MSDGLVLFDYSSTCTHGKTKAQTESFICKKEQKQNRLAEHCATLVSQHPKKVLFSGMLIALIAMGGATQLLINEDRITTFHADEAIVKADKVINERFNGSHYLDILVDTQKEEGLFEPNIMKQVEAFQEFAKTLPHVKGAVS